MNLINPLFTLQMQRELAANAYKGVWTKWHPSAVEIMEEIEHHAKKLNDAIKAGNKQAVTEHAADLANICSKAAEDHGDLRGGEPYDTIP